MNFKYLFGLLILLTCCSQPTEQNTDPTLSINVQFGDQSNDPIASEGRLFIFLNENPNAEPRTQTWPSAGNTIFAKNFDGITATQKLEIKDSKGWSKTSNWGLDQVPPGEYYVQALWDSDKEESRMNAPGNRYSVKQKVVIDGNQELTLLLSETVKDRKVVDHNLVREINFKSDTLTKWWGKDMYLKAAILLPRNFDPKSRKTYPVRYNVAGYGGRYTRVNGLANNDEFMNWWNSEDAPEIITVFLDGEGPFGDSYQMDSDNSGPYGHSLIHEMIPYIETKFKGNIDPNTRFVDGCSTGGWVSLGLQLYYPDHFNGCYSYSPDAIEFENYQLINIYKDKNAYTNEFGYDRPVMRSIVGEPMMALQDFINYENVQGYSNSYLDSGGQFSAHTALYSPKGDNGLPMPLFDPVSGDINTEVAETWKKYDFKLYAKENWETLGPKIQGKIYIWMGDMDHFYLNPATRAFDDFLKSTKNPKSDAQIEFSPMEGHCSQYSHKKVLMQIQERLDSFN